MNPYDFYPEYGPPQAEYYMPEGYYPYAQPQQQGEIDRQPPQQQLERRVTALERQNQQQIRELTRLSREVNRLNQVTERHTRQLNRLNRRLRAVETGLQIPFTATEDGF